AASRENEGSSGPAALENRPRLCEDGRSLVFISACFRAPVLLYSVPNNLHENQYRAAVDDLTFLPPTALYSHYQILLLPIIVVKSQDRAATRSHHAFLRIHVVDLSLEPLAVTRFGSMPCA